MNTPESQLVRTGESVHFFKLIIMQGMCLSCHGKPKNEITSPTLAHIKRRYPQDQAVNFKQGDLRGMWHVIFNAPEK